MSTETWGVALLILAALLAGVAIPTLLQLKATLRALELATTRTGPRLDEALATVHGVATKVDALVVRVGGGERLEALADGVVEVGQAVKQLRHTVRIATAVGAAVGPAVAALVHGLRSQGPGPAPAARPDQEAPPAGAPVQPFPPQPRKQAAP